MKPPFDLAKFRSSLPPGVAIGPTIDPEQGILMPHKVDQPTLSEDAYGQQRFCQELQERRNWIAENCSHPNWVDPIRDNQLRLIGRRFFFADPGEAFHLKLRFG
jgi:hypothetical protein